MANVSSSNSQKALVPKLRFPGFEGEWRSVKLSDMAVFRKNRGQTNKAHFVSTENMKQNCAGIEVYPDTEYAEGIKFQEADILIANIRPYLKKAWLATFSGACSADVLALCPVDILPSFLFSVIGRDSFFDYVMSGAKGSKMPRGDKTHIMTYSFGVPGCEEQKRISDMMALLDKRIDAQRRLVESLKSYKRGVSTAIFSQKITIGEKGDLFPKWEKISIGDVFSERVERAVGDEELLAVTITGGVQKRSELDLKDNSSDDKSNYKVVCPGDLPYNTMRMWQGASGASPYKGIVSPAYTILRLNDPYNDDVWFWAAYFKERSMLNEFQKYSQGLTSDTWNLKYDQIKSIAIRRPCVDEQKLITRYLKTIDARINSHSAVLIALSKVKAFFLKEMFI